VTTATGRIRAWASDPRAALAAILLATFIAYLRIVNSPFTLDDYIYLTATRDLSFGHYARLVFTPWSQDPAMPFTRDYWRPLAFLYFEPARTAFGERVALYHLVNIAIHLISVVLVWLLARRMDRRPLVATAAAVVFALYPGTTEAISWISSVNSAGLPFALASWLVFLHATKHQETDWRLAGAAAVLMAVALMFRETSGPLLAPIGLWFLLVQRRSVLRRWRTYLPLAPYAIVVLVYFVVRTKGFSEPAANPDIYGFDDKFDDHFRYYIKNALLPFRDPVLGWRSRLQDVSALALLASIPVFLLLRRWRMLALTLGLVISIVPPSAAILGAGQRYFYFSTPVLALGAGILLGDAQKWLGRQPGAERAVSFGLPVLAVLAIAAGMYVTWDRNDNWAVGVAEPQQAWVDELRVKYPELPAGGTLYCLNIPLQLALFGAANLEPAVRWYYPAIGRAAWVPEADHIPPLGPNDRVFIAGNGLPASATSPGR